MCFLDFFDKNLEKVKYFVLYRLALRTGTSPFRTALALHQCLEIVRVYMVLRDGFVSYDIKKKEVLYLAKKVLSASKKARGPGVASTSVTLPEMFDEYKTGV